MKNQEEKIKYFMYCRKSNESEDRQAQSIPDQIKELEDLAKRLNLEVVRVFQEARSAKAPGRKEFTRMIEAINRGEAQGIIAWKLNRLSRNPIDGGTISWMLQQSTIKHIQTHERSYYPSDNVLLMAVELGMGNQFLRDLSTDTKRGIRSRENEKGYPNGVAPIGHLNDLSTEKGNRGWIKDEARFNSVRDLLVMFGTGKYSAKKIAEIADTEMGLRSVMHKKQGGKKLGLSYVAGTLLRNPVYAGFFFVKDGSRRELNKDVPRMITEEQYWRNQKLLSDRGRPRPSLNKNLFPYKVGSVCGGCGDGTITAEEKHQLICSNCKKKFSYPKKVCCPECSTAINKMESPKYLHYILYHCTKKKHPECTERCVEEKVIDKYLAEHFKERLVMSKEMAEWCNQNIDQLDIDDKKNDYERKVSLEKTLATKQNEDKELTLMRARGLLSDEDLVGAREVIRAEIRVLQGELSKLEDISPNRLKRAYTAFEISVGIGEVFENGAPEEKKELILETGSNLTIKDKKLNVINEKLYELIMNGLLEAKHKNPQFEPRNIVDTSSSNEVFCEVKIPLLRE